jgi:prepilin-type N-terminal cleavage/methylation domain-containing protein
MRYWPGVALRSGPAEMRERGASGLCAGGRLRGGKTGGFSLIEILVVIAIVGILAVFAVPALPTIMGAKGMAKAVEDTSGILALARTEAMARRTYVYVAFLNTNSFGNSELRIGAVASLDGTADTSAANLRPIARILKLERTMLTPDIPAQVSGLVTNPGFGMSKNTGLPAFTVGDVTFAGATDGIIFSPNGEALSAASGMTFLPKVDFGLVATRGTAPQTNDGAAVRYLGGTGSIQVFRP